MNLTGTTKTAEQHGTETALKEDQMHFKKKNKYRALSLPEAKNKPQQIQAYLNQGTRLRTESKKGQRPHNHMDKSGKYVQKEGMKEEVENKEKRRE